MHLLLIPILACTSAFAGELIDEDFSGPGLPQGWTTGGRANSWSVVDGALQGVCAKEDDHGPAVFAPLEGRDLSLSYKVKLDDQGNCLMLIDGESAFGGSAHLLRVSIYGNTLTIAQDRGTPQSHIEQGKLRAALAKEGKTVPPPMAEQLADPKFYRTERLASAPLQAKPGEWIKIDVTLKGNDVTVTANDSQKLTAKGTVLDAAKSRLVFLVGQAKTVWIDDVRVGTL
ncbi:MAG: family 16 glycoside hydrolase [Chthoniobacter sp.]|uniref:family 16 glycoside hydrolase n=1 Tax=Chthoniobacter sp. TaxID=2510640 RepID=UPI0032A6FE03